jgi:hypothetical protein
MWVEITPSSHTGGDLMTSETICWSNEGEKECFWQREWKRLYHIACGMTKSSEELQELLDKLDKGREEE